MLDEDDERLRRAEIALRSARRSLAERERQVTVGLAGVFGYLAVGCLISLVALGGLSVENAPLWLSTFGLFWLYAQAGEVLWRGREFSLALVLLPCMIGPALIAYSQTWAPISLPLNVVAPLGLVWLLRLRARLAALADEIPEQDSRSPTDKAHGS